MNAKEMRQYQLDNQKVNIDSIIEIIKEHCETSDETQMHINDELFQIGDIQIDELRRLGYNVSWSRPCQWWEISWG